MDVLVSAALEEICAGAAGGIHLPDLWPCLGQQASAAGLPLGAAVKEALWARLLALPVLKIERDGNSVDPSDPAVQSVDEAERCGLRVFAEDSARKSFLGVYDLKHCEISKNQMLTLERIGAARYKGVTQRDLSDQLGIKGNNFHYVVRSLESQRLIMRQSTLIRDKKQGELECSGEPTSIVSTKSLYLARYGTKLNLNSQQRIEILKPNWNGEEGDCGNEEVSIEDPRPAMKAICDKLEEAKGKVHVVSDVKLALGYKLHRGHKEWTSILNKLKSASLVEEFRAKVEGKDVSCLRLLRSFNEEEIQSRVEVSNFKGKGKRGEVTDQFVELPLDQRMYDMIESEGSKGITINEVASRLGLRVKKLETLIATLRARFNMVWESETVDKVRQYRIWTRKNYAPHKSSSSSIFREHEMILSTETQMPDVPYTNHEKSLALVVKDANKHDNSSDGADQSIVLKETVTPSNSGAKRKKDWRYLCKPTNSSVAIREQIILQRLTEEGFVLVVELQKWLLSLDKERSSSMDKKTVMRFLNKLQDEGKCKCIKLSMPGATNCCRNRYTDVIFEPLADTLSAELLDRVQKRFRKFETDSRRSGLAKTKERDNNSVHHHPVIPTRKLIVRSREENVFISAMRGNGFLIAKMIRAKLLHKFLWRHITGNLGLGSISGYDEMGSSVQMFDREYAIKEMPLELFLQVVGSARKIDNMISKCRHGVKLSELPIKDYVSLMNYNASARLSRIIDILLRLKLIRLVRVSDSNTDRGDTSTETILKHALELRPYIEEPFLKTIPSSSERVKSNSRPMIRHDFILSKEAAVDAYWQTLEYCYATASYTNVSHAFPASAVPEVSSKRAWASLWVMTADQRTKLLKRLENAGAGKISLEKCVQIARELDLTVEQVLRVSRERRLPRQNSKLNDESGERERDRVSTGVSTRKRKRSVPQVRTGHGIFRRRSVRSQRFSWTEEDDRQLIMQYARKRAVMGARIHRVDWSSLPDIPAPPSTCRRRMAWLRSHENIRRALMRLCNHLDKRYARYLEMERTRSKESSEGSIIDGQSNNTDHIYFSWDDFTDLDVKRALDEVLEYRKLAKLAIISKGKHISQDAKKGVSPGNTSENHNIIKDADITCTRDRQKENFEKRFGKILNSRGEVIRKTVEESLAVANAVELLKLVFLSTAASESVQASVAATLQLYSESDIFTALTYLRDKNYMVVGQGKQPFVFSRKFFCSASSSPFPLGTGKRVRELSAWLNQQNKTLTSEEGASLSSDPQCGDTIHVLSLISSGELNISPCVPEHGVGELDEHEMANQPGDININININNHKRKPDGADEGHEHDGERSKKMKKIDASYLSRKVKGFPGVQVRVTREVSPLCNNHAIMKSCNSVGEEERLSSSSSSATPSLATENPNELCSSSCWDDMKAYFSAVSATDISSDAFKQVLSVIKRAGERGVSMEEISDALAPQGLGHASEFMVETFEAFGFAIKVNGYDRLRVLDSSFRSKYHINSYTNLKLNTEALVASQLAHFTNSTNHDLGAPTISLGECHKATIINSQNIYTEGGVIREDESNEKEVVDSAFRNRVLSWPILPWLNGDGTVNGTVYEALTRRILGTVMQKPGILEEEIIRMMDVLNPQSCKCLLKTLILEKHLSIRTLYQATSGPPNILRGIFTSSSTEPYSSVRRKHFFANPLSTYLL